MKGPQDPLPCTTLRSHGNRTFKLLELQRQLTEAVKGLEIYRTRWQDLKGRTKDYMELERLHPEQTRKALESLKRLEP